MKHYKNKYGLIKLNPIAASLLLLMPMMAQATDISIVNGNVTTASNGVKVIDIKEANSKGLSHNIYETLNVSKEGIIFNNSTSAVDTVLGGNIAANANLASGSAKVILNEVTSKNASTLNGMMEVAGDAAHLIIANPNGITTQGGGFINAQKATLTTGTPNIKDGVLSGYAVNGGTITVGGLQSESPTEILARSVKVIGAIQVGELSIVAGSNAINAEGTITGRVTGSGAAETYGIDVSQLGGMYANKISLISTESGMGVRNAGTIAGGMSGVTIVSNGKLINNYSTIKSSGNISIGTNGEIENTSGKITSEKTISINTAGNSIYNTSAGNISSAADTYISSGALDNTNGKLAAGGTLAVNTNKKQLINSGKSKTTGIEAGVVVLETGEFQNDGGTVNGYYVGLKNTALNNNSGTIESYGNVDVESTGNVVNDAGLIRSSVGTIKIKSDKAVKNNNSKAADTTGSESLGILAGNGIDISSAYLFNKSGLIAASNDIQLAATSIDNYQGRIESGKKLSVKGETLQTSQSSIVGVKGVNIDLSGTFYSRIGVVSSTEGDVKINANNIMNSSSIVLGKNINLESQADIDNKYSLMVADENVSLNAKNKIDTSGGDKFGSYAGQYFGFAKQVGGVIGGKDVTISAGSLSNDASRIVAKTGDIDINLSGDLEGNNSQVAANIGKLNIKANKINADYSTIYSADNLRIDANGISIKGGGAILNNTATGIIASDKDMLININGDLSNTGWISGKGDVNVNVNGILNNNHTLNSYKDLTVKAKAITNNKDIVAWNELNVDADYDLTNTYNGNITANTNKVRSNNISNRGNIVANTQLQINAKNNIYNYRNIYTDGNAVITARNIYNTGFWAVLGGANSFQKAAKIINVFGTVVGK